MNKAEKRQFDAIVAGFVKEYHRVRNEDGLEDDSLVRVGFYLACLKVVRDGGPMKSVNVQRALINYYTKKHDDELKKLMT